MINAKRGRKTSSFIVVFSSKKTVHILREVSQKTCLAFSLVFCSKKWSSECALFPGWGAYFANGREIPDVFSRFFFGPEFMTFLFVTCRKSRFYVFSLQFYSTWICVYFAYFTVHISRKQRTPMDSAEIVILESLVAKVR